jgi:hypothetical protein
VSGEQTQEQALATYGEFSDRHAWKFRWMLRAQKLVPRIWPPLLNLVIRVMTRRPLVKWAFGHYLRIAPPEFVGERPAALEPAPLAVAAGREAAA